MIAITGASGHVGANLVRVLAARGLPLRLFVHEDERGLAGLPSTIERVSGDVRDPAALDRAFAGASTVYHLAARISLVEADEPEVAAVNVGGTRNVVEACRRAGVKRLVHFSSIHALSSEPVDVAIDEARPLTAADSHAPAYDRSKAAGEREVLDGVAAGLDAVIVNPTAVLGPLDFRPSHMGAVLLDLAARRLPGLVEGGFDWVDVRDVVDGAIAVAERGQRGERYLLSGARLSMRELAAVVAEVSGARAPRFVSPMWLAKLAAPAAARWATMTGKRPLFTPTSLRALCNHKMVSHAKAERELGYRPRPIRETIADTLAWFRSIEQAQA
jgi:dihydroflavonol-4-reductase